VAEDPVVVEVRGEAEGEVEEQEDIEVEAGVGDRDEAEVLEVVTAVPNLHATRNMIANN